jgi:SAM-dependent methyltransferase
MTEMTPAEYWENRYRNGKTWSGEPNAALVREVTGMSPGTALDLGCGEGGDALWLAHHGWSVTAVDISPSALAIGAAEQLPGDDISWVAADLSDWQPPARYDLVSACFLHSTVELPREAILQRAAESVAPGGLLLIVGHYGDHHKAAAEAEGHHLVELPGPDAVVRSLFESPRLTQDDWSVVTSAVVEREATAPDGSVRSIPDAVLTLRRNR